MKKLFAFFVSLSLSIGVQAVDALKFANLARYAAQNDSLTAAGYEPRVVLMGNSITDCWPERAPSMFANNPDIVGRGISGQTSSQMLLRFRSDVVALHPKMVVINAGTNDVAENSGPYSEDLTMSNIAAMADIALANGIEPVLSSVLPADAFGWRPQVKDAMPKIMKLNSRIADYAAAKGLRFANYFPAMLNSDKTGMDTALALDRPAIHPNAAGYDVMEGILLRTLLPDSIFSGLQDKHHVQGVAVNVAKGEVYFSFTTKLVKTDLSGKLLGSVGGLTGHLGCLALGPDGRKVYGSIEYKNDVIGVGIAGEAAKNRPSKFYIAIFDTDKITRPYMKADEVMTTVELPEVAADYYAKVKNQGRQVEHRYGCSGIDGIAFAPLPGKPDEPQALYVAYGIYADSTRTDNDYQVLNCYDPSTMRLQNRYFVYTGNTSWGIQNLCYNEADNTLLAAVYKGIKKGFPNYSLYAIDLSQKPDKERLCGFDSKEKQFVLPLASGGLTDAATGIRGWNFPWGSTGICPVGNGLFYISHNSSRPRQSSIIRLYRWTGDAKHPFVLF